MAVQSLIQGHACSCDGHVTHVSVTWRDVTFCHGILEADTTGYCPALPSATGKVISEQSPGSPAISSYL
eukprot:1345738-Amorphochlora_amoeboformis.AAC.1